MEQFSFQKLSTYTEAMKLVKCVYDLAEKFPSHEKYALYSQIHRSIISVPSNVAESCGRTSLKEKIHYIEIAYGSLMEAYCQLEIALNVRYIVENQFKIVVPQFYVVSRLLTALRNSYAKQLNISTSQP